jgi:fatty acid desaturase
VLLAFAHLAFNIGLFVAFPYAPWWLLIVWGSVYAISISWNINSISHNFLHNPFFNSRALNYAFSWLESITIGFSQIMYTHVHNRHHTGNSDRQDENGETIDYLSIYRHGKNGLPENVWRYTFLSFFRDDLGELSRQIKAKKPFDAAFSKFELFCFVAIAIAAFVINWKAALFILPFYYLGNCLSSLNGYYEHLNGNPELPIAWGVSTYNRLYNWIWLYNGYHAEHHYRPKMHWTKMVEFHNSISEEQKKANVHVIKHCHALGFLQKRKQYEPA